MPKDPGIEPTDWREQRRRRAWELHQQGWSQSEISKTLGVTQGAVSQWLKRARMSGGADALRRQPHTGRRAVLTDEQFAQLPGLIARGAAAFGFQGDSWTTKRVATVLQQVFGVTYHPGHISRILQRYCPGWRTGKRKKRTNE